MPVVLLGSIALFNGGKSQVNPAFLTGRAGEWPFLNLFKNGTSWIRFDQTAGPIDPSSSGSNLDSNGYPQTTASYGGVSTSFVVPSQNDRPGNYIFTWDGTGTCHSSCGESGPLGSCSFTGVIAGNVLTVSSLTGTVIPGQLVVGTGVSPYTIIMSQLTGSAGAAGTYTVSVTGNVSSASMTASGGGLTSSGGANAGFYSITPGQTIFSFAIGALGSPYITNLKCFHVDDSALVLAGNTFGTKFKQRLVEANFGAIRFLNWGGDSSEGLNLSNMTTWASRKPTGYVYYEGSEFRPSIFAGTATLSTTQYSVAAPPSWPGLVDKAMVSVIWASSITSACTLNVGSTGDINILDYSATALNSPNNTFPLAGTAGSYATLVYDATLNAWLKLGGDVGFGAYGINSGAPPEVMLQLCKEVFAHPYFVTPYLAADPATDFMSSLAQYCHDNAPSWMIPRFEGPNETWNQMFAANTYGVAKATVYGYTNSDPGGDLSNCWYGKVLSVLGQQCANVYGLGNLGTKYQVICGVQAAFGSATAAFNQNLSSASYVAQAAAPQSPFTKSAASGWVSHVAPAMYLVPSDYGQAAETTDATAYNGILFTGSVSGSVLTVASIQTTSVLGTGTFAVGQTLFGPDVPAGVTIASNGTGSGTTGTYNLSSSIGTINSQQFTMGTDLTKPTAYVGTLNSGSGTQRLAAMATLYAGWKTWAQGFSVQKMCAYEGGSNWFYTSGGTSQLDLLRSAAKREATLQGFTTTNYTNFTGLTGGGFVAEFPSCFQMGGPYPSNNTWSALENVYSQTPNPSPQWAAFIAFNH